MVHPGDEKLSQVDYLPVMPLPVVPNQTASAQELRETARPTMSKEKSETWNQTASGVPSSRLRSSSPTSRPGTRNANESLVSRLLLVPSSLPKHRLVPQSTSIDFPSQKYASHSPRI